MRDIDYMKIGNEVFFRGYVKPWMKAFILSHMTSYFDQYQKRMDEFV